MDVANQFSPFGPSAGAVAFWMFIAAVSVAGTISGFMSNRETQKTIRQALERGEDLDPRMLDRLLGREPDSPSKRIFNGVVTLAVGLGIGVIGVFIGIDEGEPVWVIVGAGILVILIGAAILGYGLWSARQEQDDRRA